MKHLLAVVITVGMGVCHAQPREVIAQTSWLTGTQITLLRESCGWPGGARRAHARLWTGQITWACWGYNEAGVILHWQTGYQELIFVNEFYDFEQMPPRSLGYRSLHQLVLQRDNTP